MSKDEMKEKALSYHSTGRPGKIEVISKQIYYFDCDYGVA